MNFTEVHSLSRDESNNIKRFVTKSITQNLHSEAANNSKDALFTGPVANKIEELSVAKVEEFNVIVDDSEEVDEE